MADYPEYEFTENEFITTHNYLFEPTLELLSLEKNRFILDVGCGNGELVDFLIKNGFNVYGIDASQSGIKIAKLKNPNRVFLQDLTSDDLPPEISDIPFDTVISTEVVEHLYSPKQFMHFCKKVLSKSSTSAEIIISTPYHGYFKNLFLSVTNRLEHHFTVLWEGGHIKFWSRDTLSTLLDIHGFEIVKFVGCGRIPYLWKSMIIKGSLRR